ncbi:hypothetical protein BBK36DRAFT_5615 [Trichoderma citrinoviride]|uniref:Uncharacterized protein n=1 Tax=Trichoderma citrinoviride TaxID=58853 RepID=A0A2T4B765_9HYPO|nr:hypothetical protein BBK36DRAFT_5615 [Trichoderma citrinoviride]PTB65172.1 hypothetical protein BBK36DRAFT_5615 [Trichoderma citrinoviride]
MAAVKRLSAQLTRSLSPLTVPPRPSPSVAQYPDQHRPIQHRGTYHSPPLRGTGRTSYRIT